MGIPSLNNFQYICVINLILDLVCLNPSKRMKYLKTINRITI